jgi:hypothetical protein
LLSEGERFMAVSSVFQTWEARSHSWLNGDLTIIHGALTIIEFERDIFMENFSETAGHPLGAAFSGLGLAQVAWWSLKKSWAGLLSFLISGLVVRTQTRSLSRWKCWKTALDSRAQSSWWEISVLVMPSCWIL